MQARAFAAHEAEVWRTLRLEALAVFPQAFLTSLEEARATPVEAIAQRLETGNTFGVFDGACLGIASLIPQARRQTAHRAEIGAFFVTPSAQGTGAADLLMQALLDRAAAHGCWQIELYVAEDNPRAQRFYARHGFQEVGRLPNAARVGGQMQNDIFCIRTNPQSR